VRKRIFFMSESSLVTAVRTVRDVWPRLIADRMREKAFWMGGRSRIGLDEWRVRATLQEWIRYGLGRF
jgi:hypothetical protein